MDERKDEEFCVDTVVEFSTVTASERVDSEHNAAVNPVSSEAHVIDKIGVCLNKESSPQESGSCNGVDAVVEVSGSDKFVDGARVNDSGCQEDANAEVANGRGASDDAPLDAGDSVPASGGEPLNLGTERDAGASSMAGESKEGKLLEGKGDGDVDCGGEGDVIDDKPSEKVADVDVDAELVGDGSGVHDKTSEEVSVMDVDTQTPGTGTVVEGSTDGDTQIIVKEVVVNTREESSGRELVKEGPNSASNVCEDVNFLEVGVSESKAHDQRVENEEGGSSMAEASLAVETQVTVVEEKSVVNDEAENVDSMEVNVPQESDTQKVDELHEEVKAHDQRVEKEERGSSMAEAYLAVETQVTVVEEKSVVNDEAENVDSMEVNVPQEPDTQKVDELHEEVMNSGAETTVATSLPAQTQIVEDEAAISLAEKGLDPEVKAPGSDAIDETPGSDAIDEPHGSDAIDEPPGSDASTASESLDEQTQVTCGANAAPADEEEITFANDEGMDTDAFDENFCFSVEELQATVETASWSTENCYNAFADSQSSYQSPQVVVGGEGPSENNVPPNSEKGQNPILEECLDQSVARGSACIQSNVVPNMGVDKNITEAEDTDLQEEKIASVNEQQVMVHKVNESAESCSNICLDSTTSSHSAQVVIRDHDAEMDASHVDSNVQQAAKIQEAEQLGVLVMKVEEHKSRVEMLFQSTESDKQLLDGGDIAKTSNDEHLRSETELLRPIEGDQGDNVENGVNDDTPDLSKVDPNIELELTAEENDAEQVGLHEEQEMEVDDPDTDSEQQKSTDAKHATLKPVTSIQAHQATYQLPPDDEVEFSLSDLVWGKVRSHPWWPGQIFDPVDASEKAMRYQKKDCFFVAYFGDRTFAWNEASLLKPFRSHFSQVEKQRNSEAFHNAVDCALEEVSRRVELGLACSCTPQDVYDKMKIQIVENTGIRDESSTREDMDTSMGPDLLEPNRLVEYIRALAQSPSGGADRLELVIAKSQLLAFYRLKGYSELPEFQCSGELLDNADALNFEDEDTEHGSPYFMEDGHVDSEISQLQRSSYHKRKHNLKGGIYPSKKERSLSDLIGEPWESVDDETGIDGKEDLVSPSGKRRKGPDSVPDESAIPEGRKTISLAKVSITPKPSFKIGECMRRVASQMTGSPSILKTNSQRSDGTGDGLVDKTEFQVSEDAEIKRMIDPTEYSSLDELLLQLHLAARDPLKGYSFLNIIINFFSDFRNAISMEHHDKIGSKRRKASHPAGAFPETFEFEDMSDTYWTDRVIQNGSEEQPPRKNRKRDIPFVPVILDKSPSARRSNPRKQYSYSNNDQSAEKPVGYIDENAPAELVMHFPVVDSVPSGTTLNKMFKRFGPLKESETEVDRDTNRARVVFKRCSDAEAAYGSAPKFNIFGQILVNYQLNYTISVPFKTVSATTGGMDDDASLFLEF